MSDDTTRPGPGFPAAPHQYRHDPRAAWGPEGARQPDRPGRTILLPVLVSVVAALVVAAFAGAAAGFFGASLAVRPGASVSQQTVRVTGETGEPVSAAAAAALPSVVNIDVSGGKEESGDGGLPKEHPDVPISGNGSGVAFRRAPGGGTYIITNNHVIEGADNIVVTPVQGKRTKATLVGADPDTDIAVVKIPSDLPMIRLGDSKKVTVGALVVAIGSPYGLEHSVSSGVVSALHRSLPPSASDASGTASLVDVIQTDAAINPGNSGGALVDRQGKLIGINSAIFSSSGSNDGIGFAIPVNTIGSVANELVSTGKVRHPFLGIVGQTVTGTSAQQKKLPVSEGALVISVVKDSGAEKAGVKSGDVIVQLDSAAVASMEDLIGRVRAAGVGNTVRLKLYRGDKLTTLKMTVGVKPPDM